MRDHVTEIKVDETRFPPATTVYKVETKLGNESAFVMVATHHIRNFHLSFFAAPKA